jgi:hypothetical protein
MVVMLEVYSEQRDPVHRLSGAEVEICPFVRRSLGAV